MRLAFYTYSYTDRQEFSIPETFAHIAKTGYCGIDESSTFGNHVNSDSVTAERRKQIREQAKLQKLRVEAIITHAELTTSLFQGEKLDLSSAIDLAADLGGDVVTFHLGGPVAGISDEEVWQKTVAAIQEAARHGDSKHVRLAVDVGPWPTWIVKNNNELAKLFQDVGSPSFGVNFDPCYLSVMEMEPVEFVKRFGHRIRHVHLKDHKGHYPKFDHLIPGQGDLAYGLIVKALHDAKFTGSLAIECFTTMPFEEACDVGYATLSKAFRDRGIPFCSEGS